jgi:hypothetical protein
VEDNNFDRSKGEAKEANALEVGPRTVYAGKQTTNILEAFFGLGAGCIQRVSANESSEGAASLRQRRGLAIFGHLDQVRGHYSEPVWRHMKLVEWLYLSVFEIFFNASRKSYSSVVNAWKAVCAFSALQVGILVGTLVWCEKALHKFGSPFKGYERVGIYVAVVALNYLYAKHARLRDHCEKVGASRQEALAHRKRKIAGWIILAAIVLFLFITADVSWRDHHKAAG